MYWLRLFVILSFLLICHAWLWRKKSSSSSASNRATRSSSRRPPIRSWTARRPRSPSIRRPSIRRSPRIACSSKVSCVSCTSHRTWTGACRWCLVDGVCHTAGAIFTNPCRRSQNIVNKWNCNRTPKTTVKPTTSKPITRRPTRTRCIIKTNCISCTNHKSWSAASCRWCPKDSKCHAHGAIFTNPCRRSQNIVNKWNCNRTPTTTLKPTTSKPTTHRPTKALCITNTDCISCTNHKSWSGASCRWCPKDSKCHAHGAIFTNPCRRSQNIVNKFNCNQTPTTILKPTTSKPTTRRTTKARCITKTDCISCTSHKSWSGASCRWCPKDEKCHAHGAIFTNPCRRSQNIVNKFNCNRTTATTLKPTTRRPTEARCITKTDCISCTNHLSWSRFPCRWCPKDEKCHAHGAIFTNPCRRSQNIVNKFNCNRTAATTLKPTTRRPTEARCITKTDCISCTNHLSWSRFPCRWCPKDEKCHAHGAIFTNPCRRSQNIVNKFNCNRTAATTLKPTTRRPTEARCITKTDCISCTNHLSWSRFPCRWCPKDEKCHAHGAIFTNPCRRSQNIVNNFNCNSTLIIDKVTNSKLTTRLSQRMHCIKKTNCSSCTSHKSLSGASCRWCPKDKKCHAHGAIFTNPCSRSQNIVDKRNCNRTTLNHSTMTRCKTKTNCSSCTSNLSWSGFPCRWCPKDEKCHAHGAIFTNPCRRSQNIVNKFNCNRTTTTTTTTTTLKPTASKPTTRRPAKARCITKTNCSSCTNHLSWSGFPCRWCPKDEKCHARGAIFTNPCRKSQNIVNKFNCNRTPTTTLKPTASKPTTRRPTRARCITKTNCSSCTNHLSWSGFPCRWCRQNGKCYAYGATLTNPCRKNQNNSIKGCPFPLKLIHLPRQAFITKTKCTACIRHKSRSGFPCSRWCTRIKMFQSGNTRISQRKTGNTSGQLFKAPLVITQG